MAYFHVHFLLKEGSAPPLITEVPLPLNIVSVKFWGIILRIIPVMLKGEGESYS